METEEVRTILAKFQEGYTRRDPSHLDDFMKLFVAGKELEVIGANAVEPGAGEWCRGQKAVRELVSGDWEHWGVVEFDVEGAHINVLGEVAWLATTGTVTDTITEDERYSGYLCYMLTISTH